MKNITTPRQLSECEWTTGYPSIPRRRPSVASSVVLAGLIGIAGAAAFVYGWPL